MNYYLRGIDFIPEKFDPSAKTIEGTAPDYAKKLLIESHNIFATEAEAWIAYCKIREILISSHSF